MDPRDVKRPLKTGPYREDAPLTREVGPSDRPSLVEKLGPRVVFDDFQGANRIHILHDQVVGHFSLHGERSTAYAIGLEVLCRLGLIESDAQG